MKVRFALLAAVTCAVAAQPAYAAQGVISGQVTVDPGGAAIQDVCVYPGTPGGGDSYAAGQTDSNGDYTTPSLPAGDYTVQFLPCFGQNYVAEYYNNKDFYTADSVEVHDDQTTVVNASLQEGNAISGVVTDEDTDLPIGNACVVLSEMGGSHYLASTQTNGAGEYSLNALPNGSFQLHFESCTDETYIAEYYDDEAESEDAQAIVIDNASQTGVNAELKHGGSISGMVSDENGPLEDVCVGVLEGPGDTKFVHTQADGSYVIPGRQTGDYLVQFTDCRDPSVYPQELYDNTRVPDLADLVHVETGAATTGINAVMSTDVTSPLTILDGSGPAWFATLTSASFEFSSTEAGSSFDCKLDLADWEDCISPRSYSGLGAGQHTFTVRATDAAGNTHFDGQQRVWTIGSDPATQTTTGTVAAGGTLSTDPGGAGPDAVTPVTTAVTSPAGGDVTIARTPTLTATPPVGYSLLGQQIEILAPPASAAVPLRLVFTLDSSQIPAGVDPNAIQIMRNGAPAAPCLSTTMANPDPCASRQVLPGGDLELTVLTSHASTWNFARPTPPSPGSGQSSGTASTATGKRAAALKKCKKKKRAARNKCKKKANLLPL